ncbi:reverse transcriptase domain-containing protein [Tanacetum coccineum]
MHAIQVGREMCGGTHLERNYHLRAEVKSIKVTVYREEKGNVETTKYPIRPSGSHSPLDRRSSLEETIEKYLEESTKRQNIHASMTNDSKSVNQVKTVATKNSLDTHCSTSLNSNTILVSNNIKQENVMKTGKNNETPRPTPIIGTFAEKVKRRIAEEQEKTFLESLEKVLVNTPLIDALKQTPDFTKSLQEPVSKKTRIGEVSMVKLNARCSAVLQNELPLKEKDPKSFILPCIIGNMTVSNAIADLGASISVMPFSLFKGLGLGKPKPVRMLIEMADKSMQSPKGIIENVMTISLEVEGEKVMFNANEGIPPLHVTTVCAINNLRVFSTWMAFGGNTRRGDGVTGIKRRRRDPSSDSVRRFSDGVRT